MNRTLALLSLALGIGIAVGALLVTRPDQAGSGPVGPRDTAAPAAAVERIAALEAALDEEAARRRAFEARLAALEAGAGIQPVDGAQAAGEAPGEEERRSLRDDPRPRDFAEMARAFADQRVAMLVESGFGEDEARRILRLESEAQFASLRREWEMQYGDAANASGGFQTAESIMRAQLGDDAYARYLAAQGMPTDIPVLQVHEGSPAATAGLQPGDHIVSYDGQRIFNVMELREMTMQTRPGETVVVEIDRDGTRMQLTLPSGPIGITGSAVPFPRRGRIPGG